MSAHTQEQHGRGNRKEREVAEQAASAAASGNGQDTAEAKPAPTMTCELKSDKDTVIATFDVPRKWGAGMVNTEHSALIIDPWIRVNPNGIPSTHTFSPSFQSA